MTDTEPFQLNLLRQAVSNLNQHEKLALATFLTGTANPSFQDLVAISDKLTGDLEEACELSNLFSPSAKIFFAIELLEMQIDRDEFDEGDGLPDPSDYEEDGDAFYHGCDGDDFDPYYEYEIETFRDRRLDQ